MKKKKITIFIVALVVIIFLVFLFDIKRAGNEHASKEKISIISFVSNKNWDTGMQKKVFFKKGDKLEYTYIIRNDGNEAQKIEFSTGSLGRILGLANVSAEIDSSYLSAGDSAVLTVSGEASSDGSTPDVTSPNIISAQNVPSSQNISGNQTNQSEASQIQSSSQINIPGGSSSSQVSSSSAQQSDSTDTSPTQSSSSDASPTQSSSSDASPTQSSSSDTSNSQSQTSSSESASSSEQSTQSTSSVSQDIAEFEKYTYVSSVGNLLRVYGIQISSVKNIGIGDKIFALFKAPNGEYYINIPQNTLSKGEYFGFAVLDSGKVVSLSKSFKFLGDENSDVALVDLMPKTLSNGSSSRIVLQGTGFDNIISVQLSNNIIFEDTEFKTISNQTLAVKVPQGLAPGTYFFNVMTSKGIFYLSDNKFYIIDKK